MPACSRRLAERRRPTWKRSWPAIDDAVAQRDARVRDDRSVGKRCPTLVEGLTLTREVIAGAQGRRRAVPAPHQGAAVSGRDQPRAWPRADGARPAGRHAGADGRGGGVCAAGVDGAPVPGQTIRSARAAGQSRRRPDHVRSRRLDRTVLATCRRAGLECDATCGAALRLRSLPGIKRDTASISRDAGRRCADEHASRTSLGPAWQESRYTLSDPAQFGRPAGPAPLVAVARYTIDGVPVEIRETVRTARSQAAVRRCAARSAERAAPRRQRDPVERDRAARFRCQPRGARGVAAAQRRNRRRAARCHCGCPPAGRPIRRRSRSRLRVLASARRTVFGPPGFDRRPALPRRGGRDRGRERVSRRLRADRSSRSRSPLSRIDRPRPRCAASSVTTVPGLKVGYVMGDRRSGAARPAAAGRAGDACSASASWRRPICRPTTPS